MSNRILKINSEIQKELSKIISYKLEDPRLNGVFVTVLDVDTSPDLSHAKVKISIFPENNKEESFYAIKNSIPFLRRELGKNVKLRITPELSFFLDEGVKNENRINELLKGIKNDTRN